MKNLFRSTLYVTVFALAGVLFQMSCSNSEQSALNTNAVNKVIYVKSTSGDLRLFTCNYDGTNQTEIVLNLPAGVTLWNGTNKGADPRISPDGQKVFFLAQASATSFATLLYSANIAGTNAMQIVLADGQIELGNIN